ncbi:MAG TPA: DUF5330 domain-containing protein [Xanthobacteraceae bacterium]|nr:DUF5330 domain-containing protein [Xanthobacteraceae bacterium]
MLFLLRVAFWLSIVLVLLPSGGTKDASQATNAGPTITAGEAVSAAGATVSDMRQFCVRQPGACEFGTQAAIAFGQRAQAGAKMLLEFFNEKIAPATTGSIKNARSSGDAAQASAGKPSQNTLTPTDAAQPWRGPQPGKGAPGKHSV